MFNVEYVKGISFGIGGPDSLIDCVALANILMCMLAWDLERVDISMKVEWNIKVNKGNRKHCYVNWYGIFEFCKGRKKLIDIDMVGRFQIQIIIEWQQRKCLFLEAIIQLTNYWFLLQSCWALNGTKYFAPQNVYNYLAMHDDLWIDYSQAIMGLLILFA